MLRVGWSRLAPVKHETGPRHTVSIPRVGEPYCYEHFRFIFCQFPSQSLVPCVLNHLQVLNALQAVPSCLWVFHTYFLCLKVFLPSSPPTLPHSSYPSLDATSWGILSLPIFHSPSPCVFFCLTLQIGDCVCFILVGTITVPGRVVIEWMGDCLGQVKAQYSTEKKCASEWCKLEIRWHRVAAA